MSTRAKRNSFHAWMNPKMPVATSPGASSGNVIQAATFDVLAGGNVEIDGGTSVDLNGTIGAGTAVVGDVDINTNLTGSVAIDRKSTVDDNCNGFACNHEGKEAADEGQALALVSSISFPVGLAGLAAGAVLWLFAPTEDEPAASGGLRVEPLVGESMLGVRGTW